ncbi:hypothetical protein SAMN03080618_03321 [Aquamicrobium aerolatum DSM 21857]|uniref:Uncharacterized protein n=1 Tax=Aquamicrobium aerolatum DSM 21857 TaxID=1121003 RepID=A0A1I3SBX1_9HYPH|nr:hypothetical protein SAMN03080618_03321 [Aquamicrobium aerolatum DSM 21857]
MDRHNPMNAALGPYDGALARSRKCSDLASIAPEARPFEPTHHNALLGDQSLNPLPHDIYWTQIPMVHWT